MTQEEFDRLLDEYGNNAGTPGDLFKSREDFKKEAAKANISAVNREVPNP
ncbi:MAG: hypothetical protein FWH46_01315 [Methanimicrococcus sp.]|nr:hypothetical protein [Methanimicrococcus sp.]